MLYCHDLFSDVDILVGEGEIIVKDKAPFKDTFPFIPGPHGAPLNSGKN